MNKLSQLESFIVRIEKFVQEKGPKIVVGIVAVLAVWLAASYYFGWFVGI